MKSSNSHNPLKNRKAETNCLRGLRINDVLRVGIVLSILIFGMVGSASAFTYLKIPSVYGDKQCETIARDFNLEFGGDQYIIDFNNGIYHRINGVYIGGEYFYIDYGFQRIMSTLPEVIEYYSQNNKYSIGISKLSNETTMYQIAYRGVTT